MSHNTFGHLFRVTTFGESHGAAIGCVVDGCPPKIPLTAAEIQHDLDRRRPGQSRFTTQRREPDEVKILSGVMTDDATGLEVTTGTPIALAKLRCVDPMPRDASRIRFTSISAPEGRGTTGAPGRLFGPVLITPVAAISAIGFNLYRCRMSYRAMLWSSPS